MKRPQSWKNLTTVLKVSMVTPESTVIGLLGWRRRRLRRVLLLLDGLRVVARLPAEDFAIERRERLVEDADERSPGQVAGAGLLPRHDVGDLRQLAVADDLAAVEVGLVGCRHGRLRLLGSRRRLLALRRGGYGGERERRRDRAGDESALDVH